MLDARYSMHDAQCSAGFQYCSNIQYPGSKRDGAAAPAELLDDRLEHDAEGIPGAGIEEKHGERAGNDIPRVKYARMTFGLSHIL